MSNLYRFIVSFLGKAAEMWKKDGDDEKELRKKLMEVQSQYFAKLPFYQSCYLLVKFISSQVMRIIICYCVLL